MNKWLLIVRRDLQLSFFKKGYFFNALSFFVIISFLLSMMYTPNKGGNLSAILLISYIITAIFSSSYLLEDDYLDSSLEQLLISGCSIIVIITAKAFAYLVLLIFTLAINIALCAVIYDLSFINIGCLLLVFSLNSLMITGLSIFTSALTVKVKKSTMVNFLVSMPLIMIFLLYSSSVLNNLTMETVDYGIFITDLKILVSIALITAPILLYACSYLLRKI